MTEKKEVMFLEMRQTGNGDIFISLESTLKALDYIEKESKEPIKVFRSLVQESKVAFANWMKFQDHQMGEIH